MSQSPELQAPEPKITTQTTGKIRFFMFSLIGIFMFFIPISIGGKSSIPLDHIVSWLNLTFPSIVPVYALFIILLGALYPFVTKTWNKDKVTMIFSIFKILGFIVAVILLLEIGPAWLMAPSVGPFLFEKLVIPVGLLVPIGSVFLAMLVSYGLLEFIGVLMQPVMRPIWKTPGRSAIDAVASFVGSYSLGLLITNRVYKEGKYTAKEAAIIATGFSTVSATFMIVVANTLDLMEMWNLYFWLTLLVTFVVTAITVRIWPLKQFSDQYYAGQEGEPEQIFKENRIKQAWHLAMEAAQNSRKIGPNMLVNLKDGFLMAMGILPSIMSIGLLGLILAEYTPLFDMLGYLFYPFVLIFQMPEALIVSKAAAMGITEMFLPALLVVESELMVRFVIAVLSVSSIIFFSAVVPCIMSTEIPISIPKLIVIWFERVVLTLLIVIPIAYFVL